MLGFGGDTADAMLDEGDVECWPESWVIVDVVRNMDMQLNVGMAGVVGYRMEALPCAMRAAGIPRSQWLDVGEDFRVAQRAAVKVLNGN